MVTHRLTDNKKINKQDFKYTENKLGIGGTKESGE